MNDNPTTTTEQQRREHIAALGLSLKAEIATDGGPEKPSRWNVTLSRGSKEYTTTYTMGSSYRLKVTSFQALTTAKPTWPTAEKGQRVPMRSPYGKMTPHTEELLTSPRNSRPEPPELEGVLFCLLRDAESVRYGEPFEEWCAQCGLSNDSIKARATFDACHDVWHGLVGLGLTTEELDILGELFVDY